MAEPKVRTHEELEKELAKANKALKEALKAAEEAKAGQAAAEAVMNGITVGNEKNGMVNYMAFKDNDKYKDDIVVGVNGKMYTIQRGKPVDIPREVFNVIRRSMAQDAATAEYMERKAQEYETIKAALN